jgi:hypothetical protein
VPFFTAARLERRAGALAETKIGNEGMSGTASDQSFIPLETAWSVASELGVAFTTAQHAIESLESIEIMKQATDVK